MDISDQIYTQPSSVTETPFFTSSANVIMTVVGAPPCVVSIVTQPFHGSSLQVVLTSTYDPEATRHNPEIVKLLKEASKSPSIDVPKDSEEFAEWLRTV